jgi:hypothetical protein
MSLNNKKERHSEHNYNLNRSSIRKIIDQLHNQDRHRYKKEHRWNVVSVFVYKLERKDGALYQVIQKKEKYAKRDKRLFVGKIKHTTDYQQYKQYGRKGGPRRKDRMRYLNVVQKHQAKIDGVK